MDKFGYKTFRVRGGELGSLYFDTLGSLGIVYKAGELIRPRDSEHPIFIFDTEERAKGYATDDCVVYKVAYKASRRRPKNDVRLVITDDSLFADEMCLLYPVYVGRDVRGFQVAPEQTEIVKKVIVI